MKDNNTLGIEIREIPTSMIDENTGQIEGVPKNPRKITPDKFKALMDSIRQSPEMKELSEVVVYPHEGRYVVISGNHRARAYRKLGWETVRCKVLPEETEKEKLREYVIKENKQYATDDERLLSSWDIKELVQWDVPMKLATDEFLGMVEKYSIMAMDLGAKFWGVNCNGDYMAYRHNTPFSTTSYIGGPFQCFLKGNRCWYDEKLPLKEDYDMTLQQLNVERVVLRVNAYHYVCKQSEQAGGCAAYRNRQREEEQLYALQRKWGGGIIKIDQSNKGKSGKAHRLDYNPIMKCPIKGV
jgi:uncharacterized ParB-like nuclease family protein